MWWTNMVALEGKRGLRSHNILLGGRWLYSCDYCGGTSHLPLFQLCCLSILCFSLHDFQVSFYPMLACKPLVDGIGYILVLTVLAPCLAQLWWLINSVECVDGWGLLEAQPGRSRGKRDWNEKRWDAPGQRLMKFNPGREGLGLKALLKSCHLQSKVLTPWFHKEGLSWVYRSNNNLDLTGPVFAVCAVLKVHQVLCGDWYWWAMVERGWCLVEGRESQLHWKPPPLFLWDWLQRWKLEPLEVYPILKKSSK